MSTPATPTNVFSSQGNGHVFLSWDLMPGATTYTIQRSTDQITYISISTQAQTQYLDTAVTLGTAYYYQVLATGTSGNSAYSLPVSAVPATSGEMSLGELRLRSQQKADRVNSDFLTQTEWNWNINQSLFELYDLLIDVYEDYFLSAPYQFTTNGSANRYPLPDGVLTFTNTDTNTIEVAPPFYKLWGVDLAANTTPQGYVTMRKFNPLDRNKYFYPNSQSTIYGVFNAQYRLLDKYIEFIPVPSGNQFIRLRYFPRMTMLLADNDLTTSGISGWLEYVITDAAIKALTKEESDTTALKMDKAMLKQRIEAGAKNRDAGFPDTIQDTRGAGGLGWGSGGQGGFNAGW